MTSDERELVKAEYPAHYRAGLLARRLAEQISDLTYGPPDGAHQLWLIEAMRHVDAAYADHLKLCREQG